MEFNREEYMGDLIFMCNRNYQEKTFFYRNLIIYDVPLPILSSP